MHVVNALPNGTNASDSFFIHNLVLWNFFRNTTFQETNLMPYKPGWVNLAQNLPRDFCHPYVYRNAPRPRQIRKKFFDPQKEQRGTSMDFYEIWPFLDMPIFLYRYVPPL